MRITEVFKCAAAMVLCEAVGAIGTIFTTPAIPTWYATLMRPAFAPPNWIFGPVWTLLFALMGIALYIVWKAPKSGRRTLALSVFAIQLALNVLWSALFFGLKDLTFALVEISALWVAILATIILFSRISRTSAALLVPYLLWVSFATYLTYGFWMLN